MPDTIMYATSPIMIEIIFFAFINSDLSNSTTLQNYSFKRSFILSNQNLELTACYSGLLEYRLAVEASLAGLWC